MKRRVGFVSNSSSSSFIIALSKKPESEEEIRKAFFPKDQEAVSHPYDTAAYSVDTIIETLFEDLKEPLNEEEVIGIGTSGYLDGSPDINLYRNRSTGEYDWEALRKAEKEHATKVMTKFMEENKGKVFFNYMYGDTDGHYFSLLEHSDFWSAVPFLRISHH